jgi:hypothetical protein
MLRALVVLLLLANLLFFAWSQGALSPALPPPHHGEQEPERLGLQVRPESVKVLGASAAQAAVAASGVCMEAGPFSEADITTAEAALAAAGVAAAAWARREQPQQQPARWLVYIGPFADPAALRAKEGQLRRIGVEFETLTAPSDLAPGLMLSQHDSEAAAEAALTASLQRGVRTARVVAQPQPPQLWLRLANADAATRKTLETVSLPAGAGAFAPCQATP